MIPLLSWGNDGPARGLDAPRLSSTLVLLTAAGTQSPVAFYVAVRIIAICADILPARRYGALCRKQQADGPEFGTWRGALMIALLLIVGRCATRLFARALDEKAPNFPRRQPAD
jgi:hypothetical protein